MFFLLGFAFKSSFLIGAPTSSGVLLLLLVFFGLGWLLFWSNVLNICVLPLELYLFLADWLDWKLLARFLGFSISWKGGFAGLLIDGVIWLREVLVFWLEFCEDLTSNFWFWIFFWDWELLVAILDLFVFVDWFEIIFGLSGLLRGFISNGFLFMFSWSGFPCIEEVTGGLSSLFCLRASFCFKGLLIESILVIWLHLSRLQWFYRL